jgi:phosphoribosylamine---glycine ligase
VRVLIVGSGAREHALAWKLAFCEDADTIWVAPGNAGTALIARRAPIDIRNLTEVRTFALQNRVDLTVVGPEQPLADGLVDVFQVDDLPIFGPTRDAARLETSKTWAKEFMVRHQIPTGRWTAATDFQQAMAAINEIGLPAVLKADGLAGGKGVVVCRTLEEADSAARQLLGGGLVGDAGRRIVVEEFLEGVELSVFAFADGESALLLNAARDYKRLLDGDAGPNTGGMGGYARPTYATPELLEDVRRTILQPTVQGMAEEGAPYVGVLYAGLMITKNGPKVLEFNCRWGDPEAQILLPLLKTDMLDLMLASVQGRLAGQAVEWEPGATCGVVLAARGYPVAPQIGAKITGLENLDDGVLVFHGGTKMLETPPPRQGWLRRPQRQLSEQDVGTIVDGGRAVIVVASGATVEEARATAYANVTRINFDGMQYRKDIATDDRTLADIVGSSWTPPPLSEIPTPVVTTSRTSQSGRLRTGWETDFITGENPPVGSPPAPSPESALLIASSSVPAPSAPTPSPPAEPPAAAVSAPAENPVSGGNISFSAPSDPAPAASMPADPPVSDSQTQSAPVVAESAPQEAPARQSGSVAQVAVLMGSESDRPIMEETTKILTAMGIAHAVHVMSAHRTPERVRQFSREAEGRGIRVVIAGAGGAAHLPGVIAAQTTIPVIGVPIQGSAMMGLDSLLSIVQMPGGVPVATVAVGNAGARNAAYLAAAIIGLVDEGVRARYRQFRVDQSGGELA